MDEEQPRQKRELNQGGTQLNVNVEAEEMMDKLRILNYEQEYCRRKNIDVFSQAYFSIPENQARQFSDFLSLVSWLMRLCNVSFNVDKYDDANSSVNNLMMTLRNMEFSMDFPPAKLRNGAGVEVCAVVSFLCDRVMEDRRFQFSLPNYPAEELSQQAEADEDDIGMELEENIGGRGGMPNDSDGEEDVMYSEQIRSSRENPEDDLAGKAKLESDIDPLIWQTELERVAPFLKVKQIHGGKEWRAHIEQTKKHGGIVNRILPESRKKLAMISDAIKMSLERLQGKERYLNSHFDGMVKEFKAVQERLKQVQLRHETAGESVGKYQNNLQSIMERLEEVKGLMDERSGSMTDTSPVVRIKKALQAMKREIKEMELRMGVLSHTLMHAKMRQKLSRDASIEAKASGKTNDDW
jgi:intraflagellar transport protein 57